MSISICRRAEGVTYECRGRGAVLSFPCGGLRQVVIQTKIFEKYAGEHVAGWFHWSKVRGLPVERMEDLVLIYGCTLVTSWAAATFDDFATGARVSLASRTLENGGAGFVWSDIYGTVECHDGQIDPVRFSPLAFLALRFSRPHRVLTFFFLLSLYFFPPFLCIAKKIENFIRTPEPMRLHQVHPSKAGQVLGKNLPLASTTL